MPAPSEPHMDAKLKELTKEELEILNLACDGKSSEEIAAVLGMTHGAFQKNAQTVNRKLGIEKPARGGPETRDPPSLRSRHRPAERAG
jgi:DNA-binding CsgD family transcriptional regulator